MQLTSSLIRQKLKPVSPDAHKGTQGHLLVIGGSYGKIGSVCLASKAALRTGCGLVTAFLPKCGYDAIQTFLPEAMAITDQDEKQITQIGFDIEPDAIAIGPGMGQSQQTQRAFHRFLRTNKTPLVIDADGLDILSQNPAWLKLLTENTVLTPHPKELERLIGKTERDDLKPVVDFCRTHNLIVVAKDAPTHIVTADGYFENTTGNPALATAGSGDSLTGIIGSLLAQGYPPLDAAKIGVYLHGLTADLAIAETGVRSFIAEDIAANLGKAFISLES
jgi:hydroxyethylthiazole kinase-like uncharacterized protein yjeF